MSTRPQAAGTTRTKSGASALLFRLWDHHLCDPRLVLGIYLLAAAVVTLIKIAPGDFVENGHLYQPLQNFAIFRNSFLHLIHGQDLYAAYPEEQWDLYRYSPAFGLLFAPFAVLPYAAGAILWNIVNAAVLFAAAWALPWLDKRRPAQVLWFAFLALLTSLGNAQSNALIAGLMIGAYAAAERRRPGVSALLIVLAVCVKPFGIFALVPCALIAGRERLIGWTVVWGSALALLPLAVVSPANLVQLYQNWFATMNAFNKSRPGMSVMGLLSTWFGWNPPNNVVIAVGIAVLLAVTLVVCIRQRQSDSNIRLMTAASVIIFVTIFNYAAESPSYVIAVSGAALWYFAQKPTLANGVLLALVFLFSELSSSSIFPRDLRHDVFEPYVVKAVPCILVWLKLQFDLLASTEAPTKA
ncbi:MAG: glycosyltransferase family 87 protein [Bryobacteraceae bacterium]